MMRLKNANPETATCTIAFRAFFMIWDFLTYKDDSFVINGQEWIIDLQDLHYGYIAQLTPTFVKKSGKPCDSFVHIFSEKESLSLHKFIPRAVLPEEYGGHAGPYIELSSKSDLES
ncbi:hypothetical protein ILUMI_09522 [Ignelater luminosus]|uniref:CRAL-TRIO domain-containing protein n=1 Tax=Ignelater luminosus TaxID=2038154 RepID=A0A8K0GFW6_IGNLU|nr:hypothetical protein ILUMI_09522 [Ignelater luminosus]